MDYYKILNVSSNSTSKEIRQSWRKLSMIHHPDRNNGIESDFYKNINAAYEVLSDIEKKKKYDMERSIPSFLKRNTGNVNPFEFINLDQEQLFNMFFNVATGGGVQAPFNSGTNRITRITQNVNLNELYERKTFKVPLKFTKNNVTEIDEVTFNIDGNFRDGDMIKTKSKNYNDVEIRINILENGLFKKSGIDIVFKKTISLCESLTGFSFKFKYLDNNEYTINNSTKIIYSGYKKIISEMGLYSNGKIGNFIIYFEVKFPETITDENKEKLRKILN